MTHHLVIVGLAMEFQTLSLNAIMVTYIELKKNCIAECFGLFYRVASKSVGRFTLNHISF